MKDQEKSCLEKQLIELVEENKRLTKKLMESRNLNSKLIEPNNDNYKSIQTFEILDNLSTRNQIDNAYKRNRFVGGDLKKKNDAKVYWSIKAAKVKPVENRIDVKVKFFWKDKRTDKDNILSGAIKFILDGMQKAGIIPNDGWDNIGTIDFDFEIDRENPRTIVKIMEVEDE